MSLGGVFVLVSSVAVSSMIFLGAGEVEGGEHVALGLGGFGGLAEGAGGAGEGAGLQALEFVAQAVPGVAGGGLGDADEQQGEPAQQDVGADAVFEPVVDRVAGRGSVFMSRQPRSTSRSCL